MDPKNNSDTQVIDPPLRTETPQVQTPRVETPARGAAKPAAPQPAAAKQAGVFFSKETGRKVMGGAKWVGFGTLIFGTGSFIYRKAKGMSWGGALASAFGLGPLDPQ